MHRDTINLQEQDLRPEAARIISWGRHGNCTPSSVSTTSSFWSSREASSASSSDNDSHSDTKLRRKNGKAEPSSNKHVEADTTGVLSIFTPGLKIPTISHTFELSLRSIFMLILTPTLTTLFLHACENYQCSLTPSLSDLWESIKDLLVRLSGMGFAEGLEEVFLWSITLPRRWFTWQGLQMFTVWYLIQAVLYAVVPGKIGYGQKTLAGKELPYKLNGLNCYLLTHAVFLAAVYFDVIPMSIIADNWTGLFVAANMYGYGLTFFAYVKAHTFPCHPEDRKFSGSVWYDMFMGIEFNPRIGELWDFKLFHNGRPGIIAWTLIDISFLFSSKTTPGGTLTPTLPAFLLLFLHALYVIDFFYHEDWYLRTIDIAHDHFGFYLAWGDTVWLPFMYTLQAQYLYRNDGNLGGDSMIWNVVTFLLGAGGYMVFRGSNNQKDTLRRYYSYLTKTPVKKVDSPAERAPTQELQIWGKKPSYILAPYQTSDGSHHTAVLLTCGYWGVARHLNYLGDIMMAVAMSLTTLCVKGQGAKGGGWMTGWWYSAYLTILLIHRTRRCDQRCWAKYGKKWEEYRTIVKWKILPGVY